MLDETGVHTVCDDQVASIVVRRLQSCNLFARACKDLGLRILVFTGADVRGRG